MNILHVVNIYFVLPYFIGGQFEYFKKKGYKLNVVCSKSPYLDDFSKQMGFNYIETEINRSISIKDDCRTIYRICKYIKAQKIDVVVGHTPKGALLAMIAAYIMRVPKRIYFRHGLVYETSKGFKRRLLVLLDKISSFCATKVVCVSPSVLDISIKDKLAPANKQIILGKGTCNGVDTQAKFNPQLLDTEKLQGFKNKWDINDNDWVIGYSGRLVRDKGIIELVSAFELLKKRKDNLKLLLVGMFEERDSLPLDIQNKIKNDPDIIWTDFVNEDMEYFYAMMNVYVLLSYREGFPTGVLEAQSMSLPVVTTRVTGCCDAILDGETGFFVSRNSEEIASTIFKISENNLSEEIGKNGRKWVVENFDNRIVWKEIEKLYI